MHYVWETCWIRLEDVLTETVELNETSWKRLQDTFARRFEDVSKMSWRCLEDVFARPFEELLKSLEDVLTRRLEHVLKTYDQDKYIGLDQDVFWRRMTKVNIFVLIEDIFWRPRRKTFSSRIHQEKCLFCPYSSQHSQSSDELILFQKI